MASRFELLIVGCGYTGKRLAAAASAAGIRCACTTARAESARELQRAGFRAAAWDLDATLAAACPFPPLADTRVVYLAPPPTQGDTDPRLERCLAAFAERPPTRIVYASTTGVYGDTGGAEVDENQPARPQTARARRRRAAELALARWADEHATSWLVLRVPGIYGPWRLPLASLREGTVLIREPAAGPGNRIHVDDLVAACLAAVGDLTVQGYLNVGDGCPASRTAFFVALAREAGLPEPPQVDPEEARERLSPLTWSFIAESRRVSTRRMREELGLELLYADPVSGIRASLAEMRDTSG